MVPIGAAVETYSRVITILRWTLPLRQPVVRRRLRTVIQNLVFCAARLIRHARRVWACYARHNPWRHVLGSLYAQLT